MKFVVTKDNIERKVEVALPKETKKRIKKELLHMAVWGTIGVATYYLAREFVYKTDEANEIQIEE